MRDARAEKRTDKSPDFVCLQQAGQCGKPNAKGKWYPTASWAEKPGMVQATQIRNTIDSYAQPPAAIAGAVRGDAAEDDLPF